ncbi:MULTISPECIES: hypothetical protein [Bacillaceae]|uniref:hypothetical protein n=1 Tax=Bacillaceae TaxID=186817 RepID=UPI000BFC5075|nr:MULTISPECIES: hypothetical protein [Bacillaceae]MBM80053.1 hypothetical protein [Planctomycetaceae bacterium]PGT84635.1 hypothetical protein COD11_10455 [Bacillus sp. AFS040349]UGB33681.1 hypothetical protein LPC09_25845 [Metabacillus sp. B2-18]
MKGISIEKFVKEVIPYAFVFAFMSTLIFFTGVESASATVPTIPGGSGGSDVTTINTILTGWITNIRIIGAVVIVIAIVLAAIMIGISMGNSAKRALGISALVSAIVGIILVLKAPDLANYVITQSGSGS